MVMTTDKFYVGDGVYAKFDGNGIILTSENGMEITNSIYLECETWDNLFKWVIQIQKTLKEKEK